VKSGSGHSNSRSWAEKNGEQGHLSEGVTSTGDSASPSSQGLQPWKVELSGCQERRGEGGGGGGRGVGVGMEHSGVRVEVPEWGWHTSGGPPCCCSRHQGRPAQAAHSTQRLRYTAVPNRT